MKNRISLRFLIAAVFSVNIPDFENSKTHHIALSNDKYKTKKLVDAFVAGNNNFYTLKSTFIIRDTIKVIGTNSGIPSTRAGLFYDDLDLPGAGGTGHTIKVCEDNNIPYFIHTGWLNWIF